MQIIFIIPTFEHVNRVRIVFKSMREEAKQLLVVSESLQGKARQIESSTHSIVAYLECAILCKYIYFSN